MVGSNTSPIINRAAIDRLSLLRALYETVLIPDAVYREITRFEEQPGADDVQSLDWITAQPCPRPDLEAALRGELDADEAEAIALALDVNDLLLIDERDGRRTASRVGVLQFGGVLVEANSVKMFALKESPRPNSAISDYRLRRPSENGRLEGHTHETAEISHVRARQEERTHSGIAERV